MSTFHDLTYTQSHTFHQMTEAELKKYQLPTGDDVLCLFNPKKGTLISFSHKKINGLLGKFTDQKSARKRLEKDYKKTYPSMSNLEEFESEVAGGTRYGFRCTYEIGGAKHYSEVIAIISGSHYFTITASSRFNNRLFASSSLSKLLATIQL